MLLHKKYLVHLLRWLTNSLQHILIKCTPTRLKTYEFITEPSLIRHSQRQKELVLSQARSHVSAYASRYIKGRTDNVASNGLLSTSKEKKMLSLSADISDNDHRNTFQERSKYILCKREERVKKNMLIMSSTIRPIVSKYIEFTCSGDAASHVSRLFEHCTWRLKAIVTASLTRHSPVGFWASSYLASLRGRARKRCLQTLYHRFVFE